MKPMKRKIYVAILALCAINAFAQTVIVDKSNLTMQEPQEAQRQ